MIYGLLHKAVHKGTGSKFYHGVQIGKYRAPKLGNVNESRHRYSEFARCSNTMKKLLKEAHLHSIIFTFPSPICRVYKVFLLSLLIASTLRALVLRTHFLPDLIFNCTLLTFADF
jgi:hypothetical protein